MVVIWALTSLAMAGRNCDKLEGAEKAECVREAARDDLEDQMKDLGKCKADTIAAQAECLQRKADLAQQIADLYAEAVPPKRARPKARRSDTNRMEADIDEE